MDFLALLLGFSGVWGLILGDWGHQAEHLYLVGSTSLCEKSFCRHSNCIITKPKMHYRELDLQMKFSVLFGFKATKKENWFGMKWKLFRILVVNLNAWRSWKNWPIFLMTQALLFCKHRSIRICMKLHATHILSLCEMASCDF